MAAWFECLLLPISSDQLAGWSELAARGTISQGYWTIDPADEGRGAWNGHPTHRW